MREKHLVDSKCEICGKIYKAYKYSINRAKKRGSKTVCSGKCRAKLMNFYLDKSGKRDISGLKLKIHSDQFTPFRRFFNRCLKSHHGTNLSLEDVRNQWIIQDGICPYTGIKMELQTATSRCKNRLKLASLDRIDSSKGYNKDNIEFVVLPINYMKNQFKKEEITQFLKIFQK